MLIEFAGKSLGLGTCPNCGCETARYSVSKKGRLVMVCPAVGDGGCNTQTFSRSDSSDTHMSRRITRWYDPAARRAALGDEALPAKARPVAVAAPQSEPAPQPAPPPAEPARAEPVPVKKPGLINSILDFRVV